MLLPRFFYLLFPAFILSVFFIGIGDALVPLTASFFIAYLIFPLIVKLERCKLNRTAATLLVLVLVILFFLVALALVIPPLMSQANDFFKALPSITETSVVQLREKMQSWGINFYFDSGTLVSLANKYGSTVGINALKNITLFFGQTFSSVAGGIIGLINFFLFPIFFFYVVRDYENIDNNIWDFVPEEWTESLQEIFFECNDVFHAFIRGQLVVASILGVCYALGLSLIGVKFGVVIGIVTGFLSLIPYVGFTVGLLTSIGVSLAYGGGGSSVLAILSMYFALQVLEGFLITPKVVGDRVGLSPLMTMLVLIVGGNIAGLVGMFLAIPVGGITKRLIFRYRDSLRNNFSHIIG